MTSTAATPLRPVPQPAAEFPIDKDVPLPARRGGTQRYPFAAMEIGDSFFIAGEGAEIRRAIARVTNAACSYARGKGHTVKFSTRLVDGGSRCWRTA